MSLRQIMREQKLSNFNYKLRDFIFEADDDEKVTKKDAFAGKTDAKVPKDKYWYVKGNEYRARVNHPGEGWDLADKKKAEEAEKEKDTDTSDDMPVKERKARARDFALATGLKPSNDEKGSYEDDDDNVLMSIADDGTVIPNIGMKELSDEEKKKYKEAINDFNDSTGAVPKPEPDDWRAKTIPPKELEGEDGRPSGQQIKDLRTQMFGAAPGNSSDWTGRPPKDKQSTPAGKPPSDAYG